MQHQNDIETRSQNLFEIKKYGLIGYQIENAVLPFAGTDSEELYNQNLVKNADHPDFLRYIDKPINYVRNILGHRSCDPDFIKNNKKQYILVIGDSFTEGTGLHYEETYGYRLAEKVGLPVYNLGLAGTGIDTMLHNLVAWRNFMSQPPKILVCQWSQVFRTASLYTETNLITGTLSPDENQEVFKFIDSGLNIGAFRTRAMLAEALIRELYKQSEIVNVHVPGWEVEEYGQHRAVTWRPGPTSIPDMARDLQHRGKDGHEELATNILKLFTKSK